MPTSETPVVFWDMVAYSRRVAENEAGTLDFMASCFDTMRILARRYAGALIKTMGDGALLCFAEVEAAVEFTLELHRVIDRLQLHEPDPYQFRAGIHTGPVTIRNGDVFGHTVNVASRLQTVAAPGGCVISADVYAVLSKSEGLRFEPLGAPPLKNIKARIAVYRVVDPLRSAQPVRRKFEGIRVIGGVGINVSQGGRNLGRGARALLLYLALSPGGVESNDRLEAMFGGATECKRRLEELAIAVTETGYTVQATNGIVSIGADLSDTDIGQILEELRQNRLALSLHMDGDWTAHILAGLDGISPVFDSWLTVTRNRWKWLMLRELERLIERTEPLDAAREDAARIILAQEPGNEAAAIAAIECRMAHGDRGGAVEEFERLETFLSERYGIAPGQRIRAKLKRLLSGKPPGPEAQNAPDQPGRVLQIRVDGFETDGDTAPTSQHQVFRRELINNLSHFRDWSVLDGADIHEPSDDVSAPNADYVVEGSSVSGDLPDLNLRLLGAPDMRHLWSETFALSSETWDNAQEKIVRAIAARVESYISCDRLTGALHRTPRPSTIHDDWLRGDNALMKWTPEGAEEAHGIFTDILKAEPDHAPSLFRLASISNIAHIIWPGRQRSSSEVAEADRLAARAVALDPMDARIQRTVAWTAAMNGAFARACMHMDLAAKLNPSSPATLASCAMGFAWFAEPEKAMAALTLGNALSPSLPQWGWAYHASTNFFLDRLDAAALSAEMGGDSIPDTRGWLAAIFARQGEIERAGQAFGAFYATISSHWAGEDAPTPERVAQWFADGFPLRRQADRDKLRAAIETARAAAY